MKHLIGIFSFLALAPFCNADAIEHKVSAATIYTDRGIITRTGTTKLHAGKNEIEFRDIPANFDEQTLRVISVPAGVKIIKLSWQSRVSKTIASDALFALDQKIRELEKQLRLQNGKITMHATHIRACKEYIDLLRQSARENTVNSKSKPDYDFSNDENKLNEYIAKNQSEIENINIAKNEIENKLEKLYKERKTFKIVESQLKTYIDCSLVVESNTDKDAEIAIAYTTKNVTWEPIYNARIDLEKRSIDFEYNASVKQTSGENWNDVRVTLSTAPAHISAFPPDVKPILLRGHFIDPKKERRVISKESVPEKTMGPQAMLETNEPEESVLQSQFSHAQNYGANVSFELAGTQNISNQNPQTLSIARKKFENIQITNEITPSKRNFAYLQAKTKNSNNFPILEGELTIYQNEKFIGKATQKFVPANGEFACFAGTLDNIFVKNEYISKSKDDAGVFSSFKTQELNSEIYKITNAGPSDQTITLHSQIKISTIDDVKIELLKKTENDFPATTPNYQFDEKTGFITWIINVPAKSEQKIILSTKILEK